MPTGHLYFLPELLASLLLVKNGLVSLLMVGLQPSTVGRLLQACLPFPVAVTNTQTKKTERRKAFTSQFSLHSIMAEKLRQPKLGAAGHVARVNAG